MQGTNRPEYERLLNALVYELFFPEDLHAKNIRLFDACAAAGIRAGMDAKAVGIEIFHPRHAIYGQLFELQTLEVVRLIEGTAPTADFAPLLKPDRPLAQSAWA